MPQYSRTRRPHFKSKSGCNECKKRKVKCDEGRPSCQNCLKRCLSCSFKNAQPETSGSALATSSAQPRHYATATSPLATHSPSEPTTAAIPIPTTPAANIAISPTSHVTNVGGGDVTWLDLELLHHFVSSTCLTMSCEPTSRNFWRINVPQIGFAHPYVLHSITAMAALHLAHFRPEQSMFYVEQARMRHTKASSLALPLFSNIRPDNAIPIYFFSILTSYIAFASPKETKSFLFVGNYNMPDWLFLVRGVRSVIEADQAVLNQSTISFLFRSGHHLHKTWESCSMDHEVLKELEDNIRGSVSDEARADLLLAAVGSLKRAFYVFYKTNISDENKHRCVFMWLFKTNDAYFYLLKDHDKEALCILAYFCVLLKRIEHFWWVDGWAFHLIARVYASLDDVYKLWIRWPIEETGWVPRLDSEPQPLPPPSTPS